MLLLKLVASLVFFAVAIEAAPFQMKEVKTALRHQDKLCSIESPEDRNSYHKFFEFVNGNLISKHVSESDRKPYTGFKFLRIFKLQLSSFVLNSSLKIIFCDQGKIQWESVQPMNEDIDWDKPICLYLQDDELTKKTGRWTKWYQKKDTRRTSARPISIKEKVKNDLSHFHCFKLARRKKYTARKASLFFPRSWVGGMFYCDITNGIKSKIIDNMNDDLVLAGTEGHGMCTLKNSIPLFPLQSDDYSKNWMVYEKPKVRSFRGKWFSNFHIARYVPYLHTVNSPFATMDFFSSNVSVSTAANTSWQKPFREQFMESLRKNRILPDSNGPWYNEIEVEEKYEMNTDELSNLESLAGKTINKITELTSTTNNTIMNFFGAPRLHVSNRLSKKTLQEYMLKIEMRIWNHLSLKDKIIAVSASNQSGLDDLQLEWKTLEINPVKYNYTLLYNHPAK